MGKARARKNNHHKHEQRGKTTVKRRQHSQIPPIKSQKVQLELVGGGQNGRVKVSFRPFDNVLLVGEGDFSFTLSLIEHHGLKSVTATCYDSEQELLQKYPDAEGTIASLVGSSSQVGPGDSESSPEEEAFEGFSPRPSPPAYDFEEAEDSPKDSREDAGTTCRVLFGIDATKLSTIHKKLLRRLGPFSKIVFNFPHVGGLSTDVNRQVRSNQQLLVGFFNAAKSLLSSEKSPVRSVVHLGEENHLPKGQILVTLFEGEPYTLWNIRDLARHCGLQVVESFKFPWSAYPNYKHARTIGDITTGKDRSDEGKRKGSWRGEEREARSYVLEVKDEDSSTQVSSKKRRHRADSADED